jgi:rhodanese-related sulfurtransferase
MKQGGALVDIRRDDEWRLTGVVKGSHLITFFSQDGSCDPMTWLRKINLLVADDQPLALICRSGYRTGLICEFLEERTGRQQIYNLTNGILGWLAEGLPVAEVAEIVDKNGNDN